MSALIVLANPEDADHLTDADAKAVCASVGHDLDRIVWTPYVESGRFYMIEQSDLDRLGLTW